MVSCLVGAPKPMWVRQSIIAGHSLSLASMIARSMSSGSCPSHSCTDQPAASNRFRWSVTSLRITLPSIEMPLSSQKTISLRSFCLPASPIASWLIPSIRQPSPAITHVWWSTTFAPNRARRLSSAIAMPTALASPCPSGPVVVSIPSACPYSGCPAVRDPSCRNPFNSSIVICA